MTYKYPPILYTLQNIIIQHYKVDVKTKKRDRRCSDLRKIFYYAAKTYEVPTNLIYHFLQINHATLYYYESIKHIMMMYKDFKHKYERIITLSKQ